MSVLLPFTASQCPPTDTDGGPIGTGFVSGLVCVYPGVDCNVLCIGWRLVLGRFDPIQCPPTDNDGATLATGVGSLICIYPNLDCFYRASFRMGLCPTDLRPGPDPHRVPKFQFSKHCPKSELENHRIRNALATSRNPRQKHIPVRVITGISVALAIVALCFVALLFVRVRSGRRAAKIGTIEMNPRASTISPFTLITEAGDVNNDSPSDTRRTGAGTIARRKLETQLRTVPEKMVYLEDIESRTWSGSSDGLGRRRILRLMRMRTVSNRGSPEVHAELQAAKEQINRPVERINALEANANWAYGEGISEDPPPDYV
ncbi:hypothetical protein B0H13DRAFT_2654019 [Mycena leptocephala]|nr:hypothetical protein B0H13DRAFT_2654019 [Mycena leptocephala]